MPAINSHAGANGPALTLPNSEQSGAYGTISVAGASYSDSFAQGNPGQLWLGISDNSGLLSGYYPSASGVSGGIAAPGSGSNQIVFQGSYADVQDIINSLTYVATEAGGSDTIRFDVWNQAGVETTGTVPVTIGGTTAPPSPPLTATWTGAISSDWNTGGNWSGGVVPSSGATVTIPGGTPNAPVLSNATLNGDTITLSGSATGVATVDFNNVVLNSVLQTSGDGAVTVGGTLTVGSSGTIEPESGGLLTVTGTAATVVNDGLIGSTSGDALVFENASGGTAAAFVNNGSIAVNGGHVTFSSGTSGPGGLPDWTLGNAGSVAIANGGDLTLDGTLSGGTIVFTGPGALTLEQAMALSDNAVVAGFGSGDQIDLLDAAAGKGGTVGFAGGALDITSGATLAQAIPLSGTYGIGNFENEDVSGNGNPSEIAFAPDGGASGILSPDVVAPASATVVQGATLALGGVSIESLGTTGSVSISAGSGTLYMDGASGSGTNQLTLGPISATQLNTDLASLSYVPAAGATADVVSVTATPAAPVDTTRLIAIGITAATASNNPSLTEPASETVSPDATTGIAGSYADAFAAGNPGLLFIGISDSIGTLSATDASGHAVAGSGSQSIGLAANYADVNAILTSLQYTAGANAGSDTIWFDVWNQAGVDTTAATSVTVDPPAGAALTLADFAAPATPSFSASGSGAGGSAASQDQTQPPIGLPVLQGH